MLIAYQTIPNKEIRKSAKEIITKITEWFNNNTKRKICHAQLWYGQMVKIRKNHIKDDINTAMKAAMKAALQ